MKPRRIALSTDDQTLSVSWADGKEVAFPLDPLRNACPCAGCSGGHENMGNMPDPEAFQVPSLMRWEKVRIEPVGAYGIRIRWDDGHDAGIWTWKRLRQLAELVG